MKKDFVIFLTLFFSFHFLLAQVSFSHTLGASIYSATDNTSSAGITYSPRLNVMELADEVTLSVGTHLGAGLSLNSRSGATSLALDIPLVAEVNMGCGSHRDASSDFGGFAGIGYGISRIGEQSAFGTGYNKASGFLINAGFQTDLFRFPAGLRISYLSNSQKGGPEDYKDVYSVGLFAIF
jgi:hypothetical protein